MIVLLWLIVWAVNNTPRVEWFGPVWNDWGITLLLAIVLEIAYHGRRLI
jgi:hypothetical protein